MNVQEGVWLGGFCECAVFLFLFSTIAIILDLERHIRKTFQHDGKWTDSYMMFYTAGTTPLLSSII